MNEPRMAPDGYMPQTVDQLMTDALRSAPAVVLAGPRACGKTWTGRKFADSMVRFDELETTRLSLEVDPASFLAGEAPRRATRPAEAVGLRRARGSADSGSPSPALRAC